MRWFHRTINDEQMSPRTGFFVRRDGRSKIIELSLVIAFQFGKARTFTYDFGRFKHLDLPVRWYRLSWYRPTRFEYRRGVVAYSDFESET